MKKVFLSLTVGLSLSLYSSENFEDKHLKCTLIEKNGETISERQAESLNKFKIDVLITKTILKTNEKTFNFEKIDNGEDIYSKLLYGDIYYKATFNKFSKILSIKKVVTTIYDETYDSSDIDIYLPGGKEYYYKSKRTEIEELKKADRAKENDQSEYSCTEATLLEKIKYKLSK